MKTDTQSLLLTLLERVTELKTKMDALVSMPDRISALERKMLEPELVNRRFEVLESKQEAMETWQTRWEARFTGAYVVAAKVLGWLSAVCAGAWAVGTYVYKALHG